VRAGFGVEELVLLVALEFALELLEFV